MELAQAKGTTPVRQVSALGSDRPASKLGSAQNRKAQQNKKKMDKSPSSNVQKITLMANRKPVDATQSRQIVSRLELPTSKIDVRSREQTKSPDQPQFSRRLQKPPQERQEGEYTKFKPVKLSSKVAGPSPRPLQTIKPSLERNKAPLYAPKPLKQ